MLFRDTDEFQLIETTKNDLNEQKPTTSTIITKDKSMSNEQAIKDLARAILLHDEIAFTKTKLSHCVPLWKRKSNNHQSSIELLINRKLIINVEKAVKQTLTRRTFNVWLKKVPQSLDLDDINQFRQSLQEFKIDWESYQRTLRRLELSPGMIITIDLVKLLKNDQYKLFIQFDVDVLTTISNGGNSDQNNNQQNNNNNNNHHDSNTADMSMGMSLLKRLFSIFQGIV